MLLPFNSSRDNSERDLTKFGNGGSTDLANAGIGALFQSGSVSTYKGGYWETPPKPLKSVLPYVYVPSFVKEEYTINIVEPYQFVPKDGEITYRSSNNFTGQIEDLLTLFSFYELGLGKPGHLGWFANSDSPEQIGRRLTINTSITYHLRLRPGQEPGYYRPAIILMRMPKTNPNQESSDKVEDSYSINRGILRIDLQRSP